MIVRQALRLLYASVIPLVCLFIIATFTRYPVSTRICIPHFPVTITIDRARIGFEPNCIGLVC